MKRRLLAGLLPGALLLGGMVLAMSVSVIERWRQQAIVPSDLAFALPALRALGADHVRIDRVYHASHYEGRGIHAAGIDTNRGIAIAMVVPDDDAAHQTVARLARSFGTPIRPVGPHAVLLAHPVIPSR